jgi:hypothetical protein
VTLVTSATEYCYQRETAVIKTEVFLRISTPYISSLPRTEIWHDMMANEHILRRPYVVYSWRYYISYSVPTIKILTFKISFYIENIHILNYTSMPYSILILLFVI